VFNVNVVLVVPIEMTLTVQPTGTVNKAGDTVTISGDATCSRTVSVQVSTYLRQTFAGRLVATGGSASDVFDCGPTPSRWTTIVFGAPPVLFGPGLATAEASMGACDAQGCGSVQSVATVRLRRG
jgi:hypothetical protein